MLGLALISSVLCFANYDRTTLNDTHFFEGSEKRGLALYADNGSGDLIHFRHRFFSRKPVFTASNEAGEILAKATLVKANPLAIRVEMDSDWTIHEEVNPQTQEHYLSLRNSQNEEKAIGIRTTSQKHFGYTFYNSDRDRVSLLLRSTLERNKEGDSWNLTLDSTEVPRLVFLSVAAFETRSSYIQFMISRAKKLGIVSALALIGGYGYYRYRDSQKTENLSEKRLDQIKGEENMIELKDFKEPAATLNDLAKCKSSLQDQIKQSEESLDSKINLTRSHVDNLYKAHHSLSNMASKNVETIVKDHEVIQKRLSIFDQQVKNLSKIANLFNDKIKIYDDILEEIISKS